MAASAPCADDRFGAAMTPRDGFTAARSSRCGANHPFRRRLTFSRFRLEKGVKPPPNPAHAPPAQPTRSPP
jgi:hypothetical protein